MNRETSEALAAKVMAAAADVAQQEAVFLRLLGEFDQAGAVQWWDGFGSLARWLAWSCSMAPGTAREHVRVARALRRLPQIAWRYGRGELSYSKVRELSRLVDDHDETTLLNLARCATASQLARTVAAYRACPGNHLARELKTKVSWSSRDDGCVQITAILCPEDGAAVIAALEDAADDHRETSCADHEAAGRDDGRSKDAAQVPADLAEPAAEVARRSRIQGLVAVANHWLGAQPEDRSGEDRTTTVIDISADQLLALDRLDVPAGTFPVGTRSSEAPADRFDGRAPTNVESALLTDTPQESALPAVASAQFSAPTDWSSECSHVPAGTCRVRGHGPLEGGNRPPQGLRGSGPRRHP